MANEDEKGKDIVIRIRFMSPVYIMLVEVSRFYNYNNPIDLVRFLIEREHHHVKEVKR